jgi:hypothetical protein
MRASWLAAALLLVSCYDPAGRCTEDAECLSGQVCAEGLCAPGVPAPPGDPPVAAPDAYSVAAGAVLDVPASGVLANDSDPGGGALTAELVDGAAFGAVYLAPDGGFTYAPILGFAGADSFTYRASNGVLRSAATAVSLTVGGP